MVGVRLPFSLGGARRNPDNWTLAATPPSGGWGVINRGYTGHEHLDAFGIINMNGRVYDPLTAMFFSPDPFIQSAGDWKNYNRYSYCMNNPTRYIDPSGYKYRDQVEQTDRPDYIGFTNHAGGGGGGNTWSSSFYQTSTGGYHYDWSAHDSGTPGVYRDIRGNEVSYNDTYNNCIVPWSNADRIYAHNTSIGGISRGNYIDGFKLKGVLYEFDLPLKYGERIGYGNSETSDWLQTANDFSGISTSLIAGGIEGVNAYIRNQFSNLSWSLWTKLGNDSQAWRTAYVLGKTGAAAMKIVGATGGVLGGLSASYSTYKVIDQYTSVGGGLRGLNNIKAWDVADATVGWLGTASVAVLLFGTTNPVSWALAGIGATGYGVFRAGQYIYKNF